MNYASKVIEIAEAEVGYLEKASPSSLDDKTANAGYNNYTKYARDLYDEIGIPFVNGYAWCDTFVNWCFVKAFGVEEAKKLLYEFSAYCPTTARNFKVNSRYYTYPEVGDLIFFLDADNDIGHIGIVYNVDSTNVYTIEGNTSSSSGVVPNGGGVYKKQYNINYYRIAGYGRPKYTKQSKKDTNWIKTDKGWRYKVGDDVARNCWVKVNNTYYYFKANGYMAVDEYIKSSAYNTNKTLYYVAKSGAWDNKEYKWIKDNAGWWLTDGKWYAKSDWAKVDGKWYYFDDKGYMVHDKTITLRGKKYTFNADGTLK